MAIIGSLMKTQMVTAGPNEKVSEVAKRMRDNAVGAVLVVEKDELLGLFSERDLLTRVVAEGRESSQLRVIEVATRSLVTVEEGEHIKKCAEILKDKRFRHLPVMQGGRPVGILSARDFFEFIVDGLERLVDQTNYQKQIEAGVDPYDHMGGSYGR